MTVVEVTMLKLAQTHPKHHKFHSLDLHKLKEMHVYKP